MLGSWQRSQRQSYNKGKLHLDRIERLEKVGFTWDSSEAHFEKGFYETLLYKKSSGNPNALRFYKTADGYSLGIWQSTKRASYKKGNLSLEQIRRLNEIGFIWKIFEKKYEKGFQETLLYKNSTGNPNALTNYVTGEGYRLGSWQSNQRINYNKGKLSTDRIKRLEDIGFKWGKKR